MKKKQICVSDHLNVDLSSISSRIKVKICNRERPVIALSNALTHSFLNVLDPPYALAFYSAVMLRNGIKQSLPF